MYVSLKYLKLETYYAQITTSKTQADSSMDTAWIRERRKALSVECSFKLCAKTSVISYHLNLRLLNSVLEKLFPRASESLLQGLEMTMPSSFSLSLKL